MEKLIGYYFTELHMVGGGIQNEMLSQFTANALSRPVLAGPVEASAIGNMLMQLVALGRLDNLLAARKLVAQTFPPIAYEPSETNRWDAAYETFLEIASR
jgi:rhamnulokinase